MNPIISSSMWVSLPNEVRYRIRAIFNIPKSGATDVNDGRVVSDGTTYEDLKLLTTEKMQEYLKDDSTDFHKLFDKVVAKVNDELYPKKIEVKPTDGLNIVIEPNVVIPEKKKRGRPSKNMSNTWHKQTKVNGQDVEFFMCPFIREGYEKGSVAVGVSVCNKETCIFNQTTIIVKPKVNKKHV